MLIASLLIAFRVVVLPVEFADSEVQMPKAKIETLVEEAKEYFRGGAGSELELELSLAPSYRLTRDVAYYGRNAVGRYDALIGDAVREACNGAKDAGLDFGLYDGDSDGFVDLVYLLANAPSEANGAGEDYIWPQFAQLSDRGKSESLGAIKANAFCVSTLDSPLGLFCHELGHALGLPDLYDTDGEGSGGLSQGLRGTALMDNGCLLEPVPPQLNALELRLLGLGREIKLQEGHFRLEDISKSGSYLCSQTDTEGEYYLFESRKDPALEGTGLLIYHIDQSTSKAGYSDYYRVDLTAFERWKRGQINCRPDYQCAELLSATPEPISIAKIFFPREDSDDFSSDSDPAWIYRIGEFSPLALTNIRRAGEGTVEFDVIRPLSFTEKSIFQDAAIVPWSVDGSLESSISSFKLSYCPLSEPDSVTTTRLGPSARCFTLEGLKANTDYQVRLTLTTVQGKSYSLRSKFSTKVRLPGTYPYIYLNSAERTADGHFIAGTRIPLKIFNAEGLRETHWYLGAQRIFPEADGYYTIRKAGFLRAELYYEDLTTEVIIKKIEP